MSTSNFRRPTSLDERHDSPRRSRRFFSDIPIKYRLPFLMGALLLGIISVSIWASYQGVKESALEVGRERLLGLTQQLANQTQQSLPIVLNRTFAVANDPAMRGFLAGSSTIARTDVIALLQQFAPAQDPNSLQVEVWSANGSLALTIPEGSSAEPADLTEEFKQNAAEPFKAVGPLRIVKDIVVYTAVAAVKDEAGRPLGYLVRWRRVSLTANVRKQLTDLLGSQATLYYGNSRGDVWTDLERPVSQPPVALGSTLEITRYTRDGSSVMALGRPISGTPWFIVVEFPEQGLLAQAHRFLRRMLLTGIILLMVGMVGSWALSRSITRPLHSLTGAASAIRAGDYSHTVGIRQKDELGELGSAFNAMVIAVRDARLELDLKVQDLRRQASLFDQTYDAVFVWDWNGSITFWNRGAERVYGFPRKDALGRVPHELLSTRISLGLESLLGTLEMNKKWEGELEHTTRDGNQIVVESRMVLVQDGDGTYVIEITRDITERKNAEQALFKSEYQYRLLFQTNPLPMWVFDRDTLEFLAVNEAAIYHYGFSREEFLEMTISDIRPAEEVAKLMQSLSRPIAGLQLSGNWKHQKKGGAIIDVEIAAHAIDFNGRPAELVLANDVTDRVRAQEVLRVKNQELAAMTQQLWQASKLATMGELAASVAHELNNPLATITLRLDSLGTRLSGDEQASGAIEIIVEEIERMGRLVGSLLEFSRRGHQQISTLNVREEIEKSVDLIEYYLRSRKVEVVYEFDNNLPAVHGDRQQLRQVFLNLLTNAADAMPQTGKLILRALAGHLEGGIEGVKIEFADSGAGIDPQHLAKIWEPFFTTKPEGKGTGLGLAICRRVIEEHRGTISINSVPGSGTTVTIFLPAINGQKRVATNEEKS